MKWSDEREMLEGKTIEETADEYNIADYKHAKITTHKEEKE